MIGNQKLFNRIVNNYEVKSDVSAIALNIGLF